MKLISFSFSLFHFRKTKNPCQERVFDVRRQHLFAKLMEFIDKLFCFLLSLFCMAKTIWLNKYITINPEVRFGKPCIRGTRIAVEDILNLLAAGYRIDEIPKQYPGLTKKDVLAAIEFATRLAEEPSRVIIETIPR
jgi:uncharacterized protein (DUF433 family)